MIWEAANRELRPKAEITAVRAGREKPVTTTERPVNNVTPPYDKTTSYPQLLTMAVMSLTWFKVLRFCFI